MGASRAEDTLAIDIYRRAEESGEEITLGTVERRLSERGHEDCACGGRRAEPDRKLGSGRPAPVYPAHRRGKLGRAERRRGSPAVSGGFGHGGGANNWVR